MSNTRAAKKPKINVSQPLELQSKALSVQEEVDEKNKLLSNDLSARIEQVMPEVEVDNNDTSRNYDEFEERDEVAELEESKVTSSKHPE